MSTIKVKKSEFKNLLSEAISNVKLKESESNIQRINLSEIRLIAERVINETSGYEVFFDPEGLEFYLHITPQGPDLRYCDYSLVDGSYDPELKNEIINWIQNNHENIINKLMEHEEETNQQEVDYQNEYRPEDQTNW